MQTFVIGLGSLLFFGLFFNVWRAYRKCSYTYRIVKVNDRYWVQKLTGTPGGLEEWTDIVTKTTKCGIEYKVEYAVYVTLEDARKFMNRIIAEENAAKEQNKVKVIEYY